MAAKLPAQTTFGDELVHGFKDFFKRVDRGEQITLRTVSLNLEIQEFQAEDIRKIRLLLNVSQSIMAKLIGVSVLTIQSWEQGTRKPSPMASRLIDDMAKSPQHWREKLREAIVRVST